MSKERDDSSGRYVEKATLEDVMAVFDAVDGPPVVTSADVADAAGLSRDSARRKLETLRDRDRVVKRKTAGRVLYWPADATADSDGESGRERAETGGEPRREETSSRSDASREPVQNRPDAGGSGEGSIGDILEGWRPGRATGEKRKQQRAAGQAALAYLRDQDVATAAEFRRDVEPEYPVDGQSTETWWKKTARPALNRGRDAGVVTFKDGVKEWRWTADEDGVGDGVYDPTEEF